MSSTEYFLVAELPRKDKLADIFDRQEEFMKLLEEMDRLPPWPIDLTTKQGQRMIKEIVGELQGE